MWGRVQIVRVAASRVLVRSMRGNARGVVVLDECRGCWECVRVAVLCKSYDNVVQQHRRRGRLGRVLSGSNCSAGIGFVRASGVLSTELGVPPCQLVCFHWDGMSSNQK